MADPFVPRVGGILSADIAVPEHDREVRFYARVLTTGEHTLWREDLMNSQGAPIIGLGARTAEYEELPLQWMPHIQVADVAASVERALERGGKQQLDGEGQWAVLLDPNGAAFGIVPVVPAEAVPSTDGAASVGHIAGIDLTVPDASATRDFYAQVIGWSVQEDASEGADVTLLGADGTPAASLRSARDGDAEVPPVWMLHLPVGDLAESVRRVEEEGGKILQQTRGRDGEVARAVIQDPVGACLALVSS